MNKKRERGANYTPVEKTLLIDLISKYKHIIEDKSTGGHIINKKKEAWKEIAFKYNSNCTTGYRQTEQLKALYDNMKQKFRKNVGESNKTEYMKSHRPLIHSPTSTNKLVKDVTEDDLARALQCVKEDKVEMQKTGGGSWKPKLTESDAKILAIIQDQVEPLTNPYDSGAIYFKDNDDQTADREIVATDILVDVLSATEQKVLTNEIDPEVSKAPVVVDYGDLYPLPPSTSTGYETVTTATTEDLQHPSTGSINVPTPSRVIFTPQRKNNKKEAKKLQSKLKKPTSAEALKRIYFKKKCENAYLERKKLMKEILNLKQEHNLKMMILKKKLESMNK